MEPLLVGVTLFSLGLALTMTVVAWKLLRHERAREAARVEALRAGAFQEVRDGSHPSLSISPRGHSGPAPSLHEEDIVEDGSPRDWDFALTRNRKGHARDWIANESSTFAEPEPAVTGLTVPMFEAAQPASHTRWLAFAAVALVMVAAAVTVSALHSPEIVAAVAASRNGGTGADVADAQSLQLLSLRQSVDPDGALTVTGLVENPQNGQTLGHVQAVVYLFDGSGHYFASGRANLEVSTFAPGDESPFVVKIPSASGVTRYRVGFRKDDGSVVTHVDRRGQMPAGMTGDAIGAAEPRTAIPASTAAMRSGESE